MDITPAGKDSGHDITPAFYRQVLGKLPTGVTAITGVNDDDEKLGLVVGTFQSLSLEPAPGHVLRGQVVLQLAEAAQAAELHCQHPLPTTRSASAGPCHVRDRRSSKGFPALPAPWDPAPGRRHGLHRLRRHSGGRRGRPLHGGRRRTNMSEGNGDALLFKGGKFGQYQPIEIPVEASRSAS
jgi:hypothetical protein